MPAAQPLSEHPWYERAAEHPVVLDSDADNEIDDHFAVAWALRSASNLQALHAAPFHNDRSPDAAAGMRQSADQLRVLAEILQRPDVPVLDGAPGYLDAASGVLDGSADAARVLDGGADAAEDTVDGASAPPAVADLIARARTGPLTVVCIGAITNLALALRHEPAIAANLHVVWLGGQPTWTYDPQEFNLSSDPAATRAVLESTVDLLLVPCRGVAELLFTTLPELESALATDTGIGAHLAKVYRDQVADRPGAARPIWDMAATACLLLPEAVMVADESLPEVDDAAHWIPGTATDRRIPVAQWIDRNAVFTEFFRALAG